MLRLLLLLILIAFIARAFWRVMDGVIEGMRGERSIDPRQPQARGRASSVAMERDPVCGTFVVPERAVTLAGDKSTLYFCSTACRDAYRPKPRSGFRSTVVRDRTA